MLQSRKDELEELEDEQEVELEGGDDDGDSLSLSDRRARRKARRQKEGDDDDDSSNALTTKKDSRTRSREEAEEDRERMAQGRGENLPLLGSIVAYFRGVAAEIQKVTWPTREEAWRLTRIVLIVTTIFALVLGSVDLFYGEWFKIGIENTRNFLIIAVGFAIVAGFLSWRFVFREEANQ